MADLEKTIEIIFGGKDNLTPITKSLTKELNAFDVAVQGIAGPTGDFTKNLLKTEAAIVALGLAFAAITVNQAGDFRDSLKEIGSLFNANSENISELEKAVLDYAKSSGDSIEDIQAAAYIAISTGTAKSD